MTDAFEPSLSTGGVQAGAPAAPAPAPPPTPAAPPAPPAAPDRRPESERYAEALKAGGIEAARAVMLDSKDADVRRAARMGMEQRAERESIATIPAEARPGADPAVRLRELEHMKAHDHVRYTVHGKAEHAALLAKQGEAGSRPIRALSAEDSLASLKATEGGAALASEWGDAAPAKIQGVQQSVGEMLASMGDTQAQGAFMYGVSSLPGTAQTALAKELSSPAPTDITPAAADQVSEYAAYGITDPMSVARAEARARRALKADGSLMRWWGGLPVSQRAAIVKQLARG